MGDWQYDKEYRGYVAVAQVQPDGSIGKALVPWQESVTDKKDRIRQNPVPVHAAQFGNLPEIKRRSDEERVKDLMKGLVQFYRQHGFLPESIMREIEGIYWMRGQPLSHEDLRQVAGHYLRMAEREAGTARPVQVKV